ncbi:MAG: hypothetical protein ACI4II_06475 [Acutalibacteraceae bacterium]
MKKFIIIAFAAAMMLIFAGCNAVSSNAGNGQTNSNGSDDKDSSYSQNTDSNGSTAQTGSSSDESSQTDESTSTPADDASSDVSENDSSIIDDTPDFEDIYDSEKVEIVGNDVVQTSVSGGITQIMRFTYADDKKTLERVRLEFYSEEDSDYESITDIYEELGYTIVKADKQTLIMDTSKESVEAWAETCPDMNALADALKEDIAE